MAVPFTLTDPRYEKPDSHGPIDRFFLRYIKDERDLPFIYLNLQASLVLFPFAVFLFWPGNFRWWLGLIYFVVLYVGFVDRFILMLHNTSHRALFKRRYRLLNLYIPWVLGPFCGETPDTYYVHHVLMHHSENNLDKDLSCTIRYQRDRFSHFMMYFLRFFFAGIFELAAYQFKKGRGNYIARMLAGELGFYALVIGLCFVSWQATLVVFIIPFVLTRFLMMAGNWGQHAFIDPTDPGNSWRNSITCINSRYNRRCFNDGYHISHHVRPTRHWTDHPAELEKNIERYRSEGSVIFEGTDFFEVWLMLMLKRYDKLADHFVDLSETPRSKEQIVEFLRSRTRRVSYEQVPKGMPLGEKPPATGAQPAAAGA